MATDPSSPEPVHAYLATAGDLALPVRDANASADPHLVVVALLVSPGHRADTRARVEALRSAYAAGGPLSPTLLARTPALRREVVEDVEDATLGARG